jgi:hypothetical protein
VTALYYPVLRNSNPVIPHLINYRCLKHGLYMSLPLLFNGGPDCGPSNPLQNVSKQFDRDTSLQQVCCLSAVYLLVLIKSVESTDCPSSGSFKRGTQTTAPELTTSESTFADISLRKTRNIPGKSGCNVYLLQPRGTEADSS